MAYEHIREEMKRQGKTQTQMAELIGRTHAVVSNIFAGHDAKRIRPLRIDEVPKLAIWLGKTPNFILYGSEEPNLSQLTERISVLESTVLHLQNEIRLMSNKPRFSEAADK